MRTLSSLSPGESATVECILTHKPIRRRLQDIGMIKGQQVTCLQKSFFGDPTAYLIRNVVVAIRKEDAEEVLLRQAADYEEN